MHNTTATHRLICSHCPSSGCLPSQLPSVLSSFHMMSCGTEYLFGQFGPAVLFCLPPAPCAPSSSLAGQHEKLKCPWLSATLLSNN